MRVIAGKARGLRLQTPAGEATRPTGERAKEALFSILESRMDFEGARVLDLYAGSGQLGIEALSRGAREAVFVEASRPVLALIRRNLVHCRLDGQARLIGRPVARALAQLRGAEARFDLIFADPPYPALERELPRLGAELAALLAPGGYVVLEHDAGIQAPALPGLTSVKYCQYGGAMLSFYKHIGRSEGAWGAVALADAERNESEDRCASSSTPEASIR